MNNKTMIIGFAVFAIGILLFVGFLPIIGQSAEEMDADYQDNNFRDYDAGDKVIVYGTVTNVQYNRFLKKTHIELDAKKDITISVEGNATGVVKEGDSVYINCFVDVEDPNIPFVGKSEHLRANPGDIHQKVVLDAIFGTVAITGLVIVIVAVKKE